MNMSFSASPQSATPPSTPIPSWIETDERISRIAARRAFVEMKLSFARAVADIDGPVGAHLAHCVRQAAEPDALWRLRAAILGSLSPGHARTATHCMELARQIDILFADSGMVAPSDML